MYQLVYVSRANQDVNLELVNQIVKSAVKRNEEAGLSGFLLFNNKTFLQVLEGDRIALNQTFLRIARDPKHKDVELMLYRKISSRDFTEWGLGMASLTKVKKEIYYKYSRTSEFDPYELTDEGALNLLKEMAEVTGGLNIKGVA